jgi:hypothetical protein
MSKGELNLEETYVLSVIPPKEYHFLEGRIIDISIAVIIASKFQWFIGIVIRNEIS